MVIHDDTGATAPTGTDPHEQLPPCGLPVDAVLADLGTTAAGLTGDDVARRLAADGPNELETDGSPGLAAILFRQFRNPLIYTLLVSGTLAIALGKVTDGIVVLAVVVLNAAIGCVQEYRAANAIRALHELVAEPATVLRDGAWRTVPARDLVLGDIVALAPGDKVNADLRIMRAHELGIDESALTGESEPVRKDSEPSDAGAVPADRHGMAHAGTIVRTGTGAGVVTATGVHTELGRISALVRDADSLETPLTAALAELATVITRAVAIVAALLLAIGLARGWALADATLAAVTLAVAAIPEGLPAIVTIALAVGVQRMAARRAIVRRLPAVETLGSTTVIATDKTGTLTQNEMTVQLVWTPGKHRPTPPGPDDIELLEAGVLCNDADMREDRDGIAAEGDPTEVALLLAAARAGLAPEALRRRAPRLDVMPFSSEAKSMTTLHRDGEGGRFALLKGAPEVVLATAGAGLEAHTAVASLARGGHRVLAFARADASCDELAGAPLRFELVGLQGMIDPPRPAARAAVEAVGRAGVRVAMITGDHRDTAEAIAREVGLRPAGTATGADLDRADDGDFARIARDVDVFARVAPEHKLRIVRSLQHDGEVVAMTGDGVNDAPALEQADIGVAMGKRGTSAAREAADIVLADDDFATLEAAVEEGRRVYDNVVKALAFVLPTNLGEGLVLLVAVCLFPFRDGIPLMPIEPVQILWINLVATVSLALPLAFEALDPRAMRRPPRRRDARLIDVRMGLRTVVVAMVMAGAAIGLFLLERADGGVDATARAQTLAVTSIALFQCLYLLVCRNPSGRVRDIGWFTNPLVYAGIALLLALQAAFVHLPVMHELFGTAPLALEDWALAAAAALLAPLAARSVEGRRRPAG